MTADLHSEHQHRSENLNHGILSADEERALLTRAIAGDQDAVADLVRMNQRLVASIARRYRQAGMTGDLEYMDLIQLGNLGLLEAISRFDLSQPVRFATYATWWVRAIIRRGGMTQGVPMTRTAREGDLLFAIQRAISRLMSVYHRYPTAAELADATGISLRLVEQLLPTLRPVDSLDADSHLDDDTLHDLVPAPSDTSAEAEIALQRRDIQAALATLPDRWRQVIVMYYGLDGGQPLPLRAIAARLGFSKQRAKDIKDLALTQLRISSRLLQR